MHSSYLTDPVRFVAERLTFPVFIAATVGLMFAVLQTDISPIAAQMALFATAIVTVGALERWLPCDQKSLEKDQSDGLVNFTSFAVLMAVVDPVLKVIAPFTLSLFVSFAKLPEILTLVPASWPFVAKLALAAVVAELGQYWMHRLGHVSWLWRFHASHHSSARMNWLTGFRVHPLNMVYHHFAGIFVLMLIGVDQDVLLTYLTLSGVANTFQHANVTFRHGWLNYVFSTNDLHRWHHSTLRGEANRNYGAVLIVWDLVFGSYFNKRNERPKRFGLFSGTNYPANSYWRQLAVPFFWNKWDVDNVGHRAGQQPDLVPDKQ